MPNILSLSWEVLACERIEQDGTHPKRNGEYRGYSQQRRDYASIKPVGELLNNRGRLKVRDVPSYTISSHCFPYNIQCASVGSSLSGLQPRLRQVKGMA